MADCAHLGFEITALYDNLDFTWSGYNDSLQNYINESLHRLKAMEQQDLEEIFNQVKEKLLVEWKNAYLEQSYQ